ncbi:helix-turn-helix domain-containing protein [Pseudorhizobium endolithicum]|uniref:helix-turn-helix domain-containing protein n=1 Tax=Pseudorhizobium endolithicum TaxID=1191678 RepID=UPI00115B6984|nr:helix-turn-helix domain-containing protein [Pseudorhizobium endolithicum]
MTSSSSAIPVPAAPPPGPVEAQLFHGGLSRTEWTFRGRRSRIFVIQSGGGFLKFGERQVELAGPALVWTPAGEKGAIIFDAGVEGGALAVPDVVLGSAMPAGAVFSQVREAIARPIFGTRLSVPDARRLLSMISSIGQELRTDLPGAQEAVRHHLALLLLALWRLSEPVAEQAQPSPRMIVRGFVHLVELHAREHWTIPRYAAALGITADRLNTAVRRSTGRTPMELIHGRLVVEAGMLLDKSTMQITEIAAALGFRDPAYFSRFFKRTTGRSPKSYREDTALRRASRDTSYAAWP